MGLKSITKNLEEIPENARSLYVKEGEGDDAVYKLPVDDLVEKKRLDEFRTKNKELNKKIEDLEAKFKDVDPDDYKATKEKFANVDLEEIENLRTELSALKEKAGGEVKATKAELEQKISDLVAKHKKELSDRESKFAKEIGELKGTLTQRESALAQALIDSQVKTLAIDSSVRPEAMTDIMLRASRIFSVVDGQVVAHHPDGTKWISDSTDKYVTISEWLKTLTKEAPHLFRESQGTGASGASAMGKNESTKAEDNINPWKPETYNRTKQAQLIKQDIAKARALCQASGVRVPPF